MSDEIYKPSGWQTEFHQLTVREALGAGAAGPGKTLCLLMDPFNDQIPEEHHRCIDKSHPYRLRWGDSTGWCLHLRRTIPMLVQTIGRSHRIFPRIDPDAKWDAQKTTWTFRSGYRYQFGHCKDRDDWEQYFSSEYTYIAFDELVQFEKEQYDQITGRLRSVDPVLRPRLKVRAMSNPQMRTAESKDVTVSDPNWVRKYFVEPAPEGRKRLVQRVRRKDGSYAELDRIYLPATLYDNPDPQFVEDFEATLLGKPKHIQQAMLYGNWWVTVGSFYADAWNEDLHVCEPFEIPKGWKRWRSMDWGYKSPGVVGWWAMDPDGNIYCEREMTFQFKTDEEVAKEIREVEEMMGLWKGGRSTISGPADDQLWEERGDSGKRKADVFLEMGVMWSKADKKSRRTNAERLLKRLTDHHYGTTTPGIVFFRNCRQCITTLPGIQADPNDAEVPVKGGDDHWHDMVLYSCAYASHGEAGIASQEDDWDEPKYEEDRGQWGYG